MGRSKVFLLHRGNLKSGPAHHLFVQEGANRKIGFFVFITLGVIQKPLQAENVFLGVFQWSLFFSALGDESNQFKGEVAQKLFARVGFGICNQSAQNGAVGPKRRCEDSGETVVDDFAEDIFPLV